MLAAMAALTALTTLTAPMALKAVVHTHAPSQLLLPLGSGHIFYDWGLNG